MRLCNLYQRKGKKYDGKIIFSRWDKAPFVQVLIEKGTVKQRPQKSSSIL